jgi:hypothetical protein
MDYELCIVVEKVAVSSQKVIKRDTITSYALQRPTSIIELGLRHAEQISLLENVQNILLKEQSVLLDYDPHVCPACGNPLKKNGYKASDFHAVFSDHTVHMQKYHCSHPDCRWHRSPMIKSLFGSNIHPDLAILHCEQEALYSYREAEKNLEQWNGHPRRVNNHRKRNKKVAISHSSEGSRERILTWNWLQVLQIGLTSWRREKEYMSAQAQPSHPCPGSSISPPQRATPCSARAS